MFILRIIMFIINLILGTYDVITASLIFMFYS